MAVKSHRQAIIVICALFLLSLSLRMGFLIGHGPEVGGDTGDYLRLANNITRTGIFGLESDLSFTVSMAADTPTIRRAPTYPLFLALIGGWAEPTALPVVIVQVVLDSFIASLIFLAARNVVGVRLSLVCALLYALNPGAVIASIKVMSESLFTFILFASIALIGIGTAKDKLSMTGIGGIILGMAILCRAIAEPLPLLFALSLFCLPAVAHRLRHGLMLIFCACLVVVPWAIRCSRVAGSLVVVQGASSIQFYAASRSDLDQKRHAELYDAIFGPATTDRYGLKMRQARNSAEIVEADKLGYQLAFENIKSNPQRYLISRLRSFPYLFLHSFDDFTGLNASFGELLGDKVIPKLLIKLGLLVIFSAAPFLLAIVGISMLRAHPLIMFCSIVWIGNWLVHLPMWIEYRFWHPVVPCLLICAAVGVEKILKW